MFTPSVQTIQTRDPERTAVQVMAKVANETADTFPLREWTGKLAAQAGPRDFVGQLRKLYDGILKRWRYVQEDGEWINGKPRTLLGHTLGLKYNCDNLATCDIENTPWKQKGWGDCDDVSALVMAGVISLGMRGYFRTVRWPTGAHISVVAVTPSGQLVSLDPVAHPEHPFGWKLPGGAVRYYDRFGHPVASLENLTAVGGPQKSLGALPQMPHSYLGNIQTNELHAIPNPHFVAVSPNDMRGPRVLAIPKWHGEVMKRGMVVDGCPAVDQFGGMYEYNADADLYQPVTSLGALRGRARRRARRAGRRARRGVRRARRRVRARRFFKRIGAGLKRGFRRLVGAAARIAPFVPLPGARAVGMGLRAARSAMGRQGFRGMHPLGALSTCANNMGRYIPMGACPPTMIQQTGGTFHAQPVAAFGMVPNVIEFGQLEVSEEPTPGEWYRIRRGDTLFGVAGKAFGVGAGGTRLRMAKMINASAANGPYQDPSLTSRFFPDGRISFKPRYACDPAEAIAGGSGNCFALMWIPPAPGIEPPAIEPEPEPEPEPPPPPPMLPVVMEPVVPETPMVPAPPPIPITPAPVPPIPPPPVVQEPVPVPVEPPPAPSEVLPPVVELPVPPMEPLPPMPPVEPVPAPAEPDIPEPPPAEEELAPVEEDQLPPSVIVPEVDEPPMAPIPMPPPPPAQPVIPVEEDRVVSEEFPEDPGPLVVTMPVYPPPPPTQPMPPGIIPVTYQPPTFPTTYAPDQPGGIPRIVWQVGIPLLLFLMARR